MPGPLGRTTAVRACGDCKQWAARQQETLAAARVAERAVLAEPPPEPSLSDRFAAFVFGEPDAVR